MRFEGIDCFGLIGAKKIDFLTHVTQYKNNDTVGSNPKLKNYILDGKVCESLVEANNLNLKLENLLNKVDCYNGNSIVEKIKYLIKKIILKLIMWKLRPIFELQIAINKNIYQGLYYQLLNNISQNDVDVCLCDTTNMSFNDCMSTTLIYADYVLHSSKPSILIFCFKEYDTVLMECILADLDELDVHSVFFLQGTELLHSSQIRVKIYFSSTKENSLPCDCIVTTNRDLYSENSSKSIYYQHDWETTVTRCIFYQCEKEDS